MKTCDSMGYTVNSIWDNNMRKPLDTMGSRLKWLRDISNLRQDDARELAQNLSGVTFGQRAQGAMGKTVRPHSKRTVAIYCRAWQLR